MGYLSFCSSQIVQFIKNFFLQTFPRCFCFFGFSLVADVFALVAVFFFAGDDSEICGKDQQVVKTLDNIFNVILNLIENAIANKGFDVTQILTSFLLAFVLRGTRTSGDAEFSWLAASSG